MKPRDSKIKRKLKNTETQNDENPPSRSDSQEPISQSVSIQEFVDDNSKRSSTKMRKTESHVRIKEETTEITNEASPSLPRTPLKPTVDFKHTQSIMKKKETKARNKGTIDETNSKQPSTLDLVDKSSKTRPIDSSAEPQEGERKTTSIINPRESHVRIKEDQAEIKSSTAVPSIEPINSSVEFQKSDTNTNRTQTTSKIKWGESHVTMKEEEAEILHNISSHPSEDLLKELKPSILLSKIKEKDSKVRIKNENRETIDESGSSQPSTLDLVDKSSKIKSTESTLRIKDSTVTPSVRLINSSVEFHKSVTQTTSDIKQGESHVTIKDDEADILQNARTYSPVNSAMHPKGSMLSSKIKEAESKAIVNQSIDSIHKTLSNMNQDQNLSQIPSEYGFAHHSRSTRLLLSVEKDSDVESIQEEDESEESIRITGLSETEFFRKSIHNFFQLYWRTLFAFSWPILLSFIFIFGTNKKIRCLYVELLMWGYWTFDVLPEAITALIPIFTLPLLMIQHAYTTCTIYFQYGFFSLNTFFISICLDYSGLHERIIFYLMFKFGGTPRVAHLVLSTVCGIISVRIANAYTAHMMLPIIKKILYEVDIRKIKESRINVAISRMNFKHHEIRQTPVNLSMALICGVVYASCFGGLNFVSGTITNLVFKSSYQRRFPNCNIAQTAWYCYTMPLAIVGFLISLAWVQILYLGLWRVDKNILKEYHLLKKIFKNERIIEKLYYRLGDITLREICVAVAFMIYLIIWYLDGILYFKKNSDDIFFVKFVGESTPFMIITFSLMLLPASLQFLLSFHPNPKRRPTCRSRRLMSWEILQSRTPWSRILVLGGCVAMAQAQFSTGLAEAAASKLFFMKDLNYWVLLFIVTLFANIVTETLSNGIICGICTPLIIEFSVLCKVHPVYLGLPFALCCSFGLLHEYASLLIRKVLEISELPKKQFLIAGIFPKIYGWVLILVTFEIYGKLIFHEGAVFPSNFLDKNISCYCEPCPFNLSKIHNW